MGRLRETTTAGLRALLRPIVETIEFDYLFHEAIELLKKQREQLASDRRALREWRRAEPCLGLQQLEAEHDACDYCNLGGGWGDEHRAALQERAAGLAAVASEIMNRRGWDASGRRKGKR